VYQVITKKYFVIVCKIENKFQEIKKQVENSNPFGENWLLIYETEVKKKALFNEIDKVIDGKYMQI